MTSPTGGAGYGTTTEEMARAGQRVLDTDARVQADLAALATQLTPLAGAWRGEAATAFGSLMARWETDARQLSAALRGIGEAITGSGRTYQQAEADGSAALTSIRAALG